MYSTMPDNDISIQRMGNYNYFMDKVMVVAHVQFHRYLTSKYYTVVLDFNGHEFSGNHGVNGKKVLRRSFLFTE